MGLHVVAATGRRRRRFQKLKVDFRVVGVHESKRDHSPAAQVRPDKGVYSVAVLESIEQRRQTFGLIV
jgi:hypothetical protein